MLAAKAQLLLQKALLQPQLFHIAFPGLFLITNLSELQQLFSFRPKGEHFPEDQKKACDWCKHSPSFV
jgi:hypothetical protein